MAKRPLKQTIISYRFPRLISDIPRPRHQWASPAVPNDSASYSHVRHESWTGPHPPAGRRAEVQREANVCDVIAMYGVYVSTVDGAYADIYLNNVIRQFYKKIFKTFMCALQTRTGISVEF